MKFTLLIALIFASLIGQATPQVYFNYKVFYTPEQDSYITTMLQFSSGTFKYNSNDKGDLYTEVEITQIFRAEDSIVLADKYVLTSPLMKDSIVEDFFDIQNYGLAPGVYNYELIIKDLISGEEVSGEQSVLLKSFTPNHIQLSDIEFISDAYQSTEQNNFTKNGFFMLPYLTNYFPPENDKIAFYFEIYNADKVIGKEEKYLLTYGITDYQTGEKIADIFKFQKVQTDKVTPIIAFLPIDKVPTGEFSLDIHLIDKTGDTLITNNTYFQRRNDAMDSQLITLEDIEIDRSFQTEIARDSIPYFLASLMPISPRYEYESIRQLFKEKDTTQMEKYFYAFWKQTSPEKPYDAWLKYRAQVYYTQELFGTQIKAGFETDRGRIYLKYGAPNSVIDRPNEPSAYPYQIWHYYRIGQRSNIMFVFYNPDLITNDYPMLHSELPGEIQNYRWETVLHQRDTPNTNLDNPGESGTIHYGGNSGLYFRNP